MLVAPPALISSFAPTQVAIAQTEPEYSHEHDQAHDYEHFFIGVDGLEDLRTDKYAGLENPNYNLLTFLFSHVEDDPTTNHFHGIGAYSYSGSVDNPTINSTSSNNRIPESYTGLPPLTLQPGTGIYADRLVSMPTTEEYSNLEIEPVSFLQNYDDLGADYLFNSSGGRWSSPLGDAVIGLELVEKRSGLNIANEAGMDILTQAGDIYTIGSDDNFAFTPTFWTDASAAAGTYSATFQLRDLGIANNRSAFGESGTFSLDFQVTPVPEPSPLLGLGVFGYWHSLGKAG